MYASKKMFALKIVHFTKPLQSADLAPPQILQTFCIMTKWTPSHATCRYIAQSQVQTKQWNGIFI